jgi:hypothetical protein
MQHTIPVLAISTQYYSDGGTELPKMAAAPPHAFSLFESQLSAITYSCTPICRYSSSPINPARGGPGITGSDSSRSLSRELFFTFLFFWGTFSLFVGSSLVGILSSDLTDVMYLQSDTIRHSSGVVSAASNARSPVNPAVAPRSPRPISANSVPLNTTQMSSHPINPSPHLTFSSNTHPRIPYKKNRRTQMQQKKTSTKINIYPARDTSHDTFPHSRPSKRLDCMPSSPSRFPRDRTPRQSEQSYSKRSPSTPKGCGASSYS